MGKKLTAGFVVEWRFWCLVFLTSAILVLWQNCGRVDVLAPAPHPELEEVIFVSQSMVVDLRPNSSRTVKIEPEPGSAPISSVSLSVDGSVYQMTTDRNSHVVLDSKTHELTFTPAPGYQGFDQVKVYLFDSRGNDKALAVTFVVKNFSEDQLSNRNLLVYGEGDEPMLQGKIEGVDPPTMAEVFSTWGRFEQNDWYPIGTEPQGQAASWQFLENPERVSCLVNSTHYLGFVSSMNFEYYKHSAILTSSSRDDDSIFLIIAFVRENNTNYVLSAVRTQGGMIPQFGWGLVYHEAGGPGFSPSWLINSKSVGGTFRNANGDDGWSNRKSRVQVERKGDIIEIMASPWHENESFLALAPDSKIVVDLNSDPRLARFKGAQSYGYGSHSQQHTTFLDVQFSTGMDDQFVYDLVNNIVYELQDEGGYSVRPDIDAFDHIGYPRQVRNPDTGKTYMLLPNKTYSLVP